MLANHFWFPQSLLFLRDGSLQGFNRDVYVLIKILKFCTGSSAKSYQCKFALSNVIGIRGKKIEAGDLGSIVQKVIHYHTLRGKFSSVHPELREEGIIKVEVGEEGLHFIRGKGATHDLLILEQRQHYPSII